MKRCDKTITVFNKRWDAEAGKDVYIPTVIKGVSWFCEIASAVDSNGLHAANRFVVRIPADANFGDKVYVDPVSYASETIVSGLFTLGSGDVIVKAELPDSTLKPAQLHEQYADCMTILGVTDSSDAPNAPHWKVVGQ